jgi:hypothetical protein
VIPQASLSLHYPTPCQCRHTLRTTKAQEIWDVGCEIQEKTKVFDHTSHISFLTSVSVCDL